jgi:hypothetical protein
LLYNKTLYSEDLCLSKNRLLCQRPQCRLPNLLQCLTLVNIRLQPSLPTSLARLAARKTLCRPTAACVAAM